MLSTDKYLCVKSIPSAKANAEFLSMTSSAETSTVAVNELHVISISLNRSAIFDGKSLSCNVGTVMSSLVKNLAIPSLRYGTVIEFTTVRSSIVVPMRLLRDLSLVPLE